jgi:hypothetical protein
MRKHSQTKNTTAESERQFRSGLLHESARYQLENGILGQAQWQRTFFPKRFLNVMSTISLSDLSYTSFASRPQAPPFPTAL